jgi:hypothetical protein
MDWMMDCYSKTTIRHYDALCIITVFDLHCSLPNRLSNYY